MLVGAAFGEYGPVVAGAFLTAMITGGAAAVTYVIHQFAIIHDAIARSDASIQVASEKLEGVDSRLNRVEDIVFSAGSNWHPVAR